MIKSYPLLPRWQWMSFVPIAVILVAGTYAVVGFSGTEFWWWAYAIMALPALLAIVMAVSMRRLNLELSATGLRYRGGGYVATAEWSNVSRAAGNRQVLILQDLVVEYSPWLGWMAAIARGFAPFHSNRASAAMRLVHLKYFDDGTMDATLSKVLP